MKKKHLKVLHTQCFSIPLLSKMPISRLTSFVNLLFSSLNCDTSTLNSSTSVLKSCANSLQMVIALSTESISVLLASAEALRLPNSHPITAVNITPAAVSSIFILIICCYYPVTFFIVNKLYSNY